MSENDEKKLPILLNCKSLLNPVIATQRRIDIISDEVNKSDTSIVARDGFFVLSVASIETMIMDILRYCLRCIPYKLRQQTFNVGKDDLLYRPRTLIELEIDKELISISYDNIEGILEYFCNILSIDKAVFSSVIEEQLREIKASRNLLLHNNLVVNKTYIEKAGTLKRKDSVGDKLEIDTAYLVSTLELFGTICNIIENAITTKYKSYTRVASIKSLWQYLFSSPVMVFEDYWQIDLAKDKVVSYKGSKYEDEDLLSNSEMMFLGVWRSHFHGRAINLDRFSMYSLDKTYQEKMLFFLSILDDLRLE